MPDKCDIEGCGRTATSTFGKNDKCHLCSMHHEAWGYFRRGYYTALGKESDGYVHLKLWDKAMNDFLEWCRVEIVACTQIAEAALRVKAIKNKQ